MKVFTNWQEISRFYVQLNLEPEPEIMQCSKKSQTEPDSFVLCISNTIRISCHGSTSEPHMTPVDFLKVFQDSCCKSLHMREGYIVRHSHLILGAFGSQIVSTSWTFSCVQFSISISASSFLFLEVDRSILPLLAFECIAVLRPSLMASFLFL